MPRRPAPAVILSDQVSRSRYFFLELDGAARAGVTPAYGGAEQCTPDFFVERDRFPLPTVELVVNGAGTVLLDGRRHPLRAGSLFCYDAGTSAHIRTDPHQPMTKYFLCLAGARAGVRLRAAGLRPGGLVQLAMFSEAQRVWDELIREGAHHRPMAAPLAAALTEVLLLKLEQLAGRSLAPGPASEESFLQAKAIIETQAASLATLGDLTRATGLGATRLGRLFRRYQGLSPYQFLLHRKMTLAAELLMHPATQVKEAAAQVGFADPAHFSRCFKQVHRVAPRDFQRARLGG